MFPSKLTGTLRRGKTAKTNGPPPRENETTGARKKQDKKAAKFSAAGGAPSGTPKSAYEPEIARRGAFMRTASDMSSSMGSAYGAGLESVTEHTQPETFIKLALDDLTSGARKVVEKKIEDNPAVKQAMTEAAKTREGRDLVMGLVYEMAGMDPVKLEAMSQKELLAVLAQPFVHGDTGDMHAMRHAAKMMEVKAFKEAAVGLTEKAEAMGAEVLQLQSEIETLQLDKQPLLTEAENLVQQRIGIEEDVQALLNDKPLSAEQEARLTAYEDQLDRVTEEMGLHPGNFDHPDDQLQAVLEHIDSKLQHLDDAIFQKSADLHTLSKEQDSILERAEKRLAQADERKHRDSADSATSFKSFGSLENGTEVREVQASMKMVTQYDKALKLRQALQKDLVAQLKEAKFDKAGTKRRFELGASLDAAMPGLSLGVDVNFEAFSRKDGNIYLSKGMQIAFGLGGDAGVATGKLTFPVTGRTQKAFQSVEQLASYLTDHIISSGKMTNIIDSGFLGIDTSGGKARSEGRKVDKKALTEAYGKLAERLELAKAGVKHPQALIPKKEYVGEGGVFGGGAVKLGTWGKLSGSALGKARGKLKIKRAQLDAGMPATPNEARASFKLDGNRQFKIPGFDLKGKTSREQLQLWHQNITAMAGDIQEGTEPAELASNRNQLLKMSREMTQMWNEYSEVVKAADKKPTNKAESKAVKAAKARKAEMEAAMGVKSDPMSRLNMRSNRARMRREVFHTMMALTHLYQATLTEASPVSDQAALKVMEARLNHLKFPEYTLEKNSPRTLTAKQTDTSYRIEGQIRGTAEFGVGAAKVRIAYERTDRTQIKDSNDDLLGTYRIHRFTLGAGSDMNHLLGFLSDQKLDMGPFPNISMMGTVTVEVESKQTGLVPGKYDVQAVRILSGGEVGGDAIVVRGKATTQTPSLEVWGSNTVSYAETRYHGMLRARVGKDLEPAHTAFKAEMDAQKDVFKAMIGNMLDGLDDTQHLHGAAREMQVLIADDMKATGKTKPEDTETHKILTRMKSHMADADANWEALKTDFVQLLDHQTDVQYTGSVKPTAKF